MTWRDRLRPGISDVSALRLFDYARDPGLARLDCNELSFEPDEEELAELRAELAKLELNRYPNVSGEPLRRALATQWKVDPDEILLGNGSIEVLAILVTALGCAPSGGAPTVLYPEPSFPHFEVLARTHGSRPVSVPLRADFSLDERALATAIDVHRPALAIFASPNNPTGNAFDRDVLAPRATIRWCFRHR